MRTHCEWVDYNYVMEGPIIGQIKALRCRECGKEYPATLIYACEDCFAPLDVVYEYDRIALTADVLTGRPKTLWRYFELLPIANPSHVVDLGTGLTPLHRASRLGEALGIDELYVKNDTVNPTFSFKDRPTSVAISKAREFGLSAVGCASTGNLAAAVSAHAAKAGLPCYVVIPADTELNKTVQASVYGATIVAVNGTYDEANRLAMRVADDYGWGFVNFNIRPYYVEGSKTLAYEVCEQLNWTPPDHVVIPIGSGALLCANHKGFNELRAIGLIDDVNIKISGAQPLGCSPVVSAFKTGGEFVEPIEYPDTFAKSLAIGDPGDGLYTVRRIRETGGYAESATDPEIVEAIKLLAKTEGIFAEPAGAVTVAALKNLVERGDVAADERVVCYVTGNGLKTPEAIIGHVPRPVEIEPRLDAFNAAIGVKEVTPWLR
jgi:threonine synthase